MSARPRLNRDYLHSQLLNKIMYCEWEPGMRIDESAVAEEFGVSKTPVREALFMLARDHFVDIYPQSGTFVAKIDIKRVKDVIYLRNSVEKTVLLELITKGVEVPEKIDNSTLLMEYAAKEKNWVDYAAIDYNFHRDLYRLAGHEELWDMIQNYMPHYTRTRFFCETVHDEADSTIEDHRQYLAALRSRSASALKKIIDIHCDVNLSRAYKQQAFPNYYNYFSNFEYL